MNTRERFDAILNFRRPDRLPVIEWATWWDKTLERWYGEGLPRSENCVEQQRYFGLDTMVQEWFAPGSSRLPAPAAHGAGLLATPEEYRAMKRDGLLFDPANIRWNNFERYRPLHDRGEAVFWFTLEGFFWFPRTLLGIENHLYAFYDQPELMKEINQDQVDYSLRLLEQLFRHHKPEFMTFAEDMSYNHGPMLSEALFDEFVFPYYQQLVPFLKEHGVKVFIDSDGDITECVHWFKRAGIEGILPLERQAGVDVNQLRHDHPDFRMLGAFNKLVMHRGEAAVRQEFERLMPAVRTGGVLIACDHQTPPAVSLNDYQLYLELFREYAQGM